MGAKGFFKREKICNEKYCKQLQVRYYAVMVKSPMQRIIDRRKQCRIAICGKGMQRKKRTEQLSLRNGRAMELKLVKNDEALYELKGFWSAGKRASK